MEAQRSLFDGEAARDAGIGRVTDHNETWMHKALACVVKWAPTQTDFIGEDIQIGIRFEVGQPTNPNAWGALTLHCLRAKIIEPTGEWRKMKKVKSHARKSPVYRSYTGAT